jgi:hypothetical protein
MEIVREAKKRLKHRGFTFDHNLTFVTGQRELTVIASQQLSLEETAAAVVASAIIQAQQRVKEIVIFETFFSSHSI